MSAQRVNMEGYTEFMTLYGPCHFLLCTKEFGENAKRSYPEGKFPEVGGIYTPKSIYCLKDDLSGSQIPFFNLKEVNLGKEDVGYISFNFTPFPFSPN